LGFDNLSNSLAFSSLYYFLFIINHQWKVNQGHVTVGTGMSRHLSNGFLRSRWLVDASTVANWSMYFNKLTADIPYISYANPTKNITHLNGLFHIAIGENWIVEFRGLRIKVINFWIQPSDSSIQAGLTKKKYLRRWEGCPKHMDTIVPCSDWWELDCWIQNFTNQRLNFWIPKKNISEGERVSETQAGEVPLNNTPRGRLVHGSRKTKWVTCWVAPDSLKLWLNWSCRRLFKHTSSKKKAFFIYMPQAKSLC